MSTLQPHEVTKVRDYENSYEFTRRLHIRPRKKLSSDMLDFFEMIRDDYDVRQMIENLTGKAFSPDLKINCVRMQLDDKIEPYGDIALITSMIILIPVSAFLIYKRLKAYTSGVTIVLRGRMSYDQHRKNVTSEGGPVAV